jgi:hypothetical protein
MIQSLTINNGLVALNGTTFLNLQTQSPEVIYRELGLNYPKFFKMDLLCKWAWLGAEILLKTTEGMRYDHLNKEKIAVVLATGKGCLAVDKKYLESMQTVASPALFVYTLPNIMLGEICIRHGFKGEQLCMVQESFNSDELSFWINDLFKHRKMEHCLTGWVDATEDKHEVQLFWVSRTMDSVILPLATESPANTE